MVVSLLEGYGHLILIAGGTIREKFRRHSSTGAGDAIARRPQYLKY